MLSVIGQLVNQKIAPGLDVGFRSKLIKLFYEIDHTYKKDLAAVQENGMALKHVKHQTPDLCLAAVKKDGLALEYVKHQTPDLCLAAVKQNGLALMYVKHQTDEVRFVAVEKDPKALYYC